MSENQNYKFIDYSKINDINDFLNKLNGKAKNYQYVVFVSNRCLNLLSGGLLLILYQLITSFYNMKNVLNIMKNMAYFPKYY